MTQGVVNLREYRQRRTRARVFLALETLYLEAINKLGDDIGRIDPDELEEFLVQVLTDFLTFNLDDPTEVHCLDEKYRHFDERLRACLQTRLHTLQQFSRTSR